MNGKLRMKCGGIALLLTLFSFQLFAQKFTASANRSTVEVGQQFQISFTLNTGGSRFQPPALSGLDVYSGPNQSTSMQFVNGSMSQSISYSYIVAAKKVGKLTIGPAKITANGDVISSNPITITVVKGNPKTASQSQSRQQQSAGGNTNSRQARTPGQNISKNLFIRTIVSRRRVYLGEEIIVTHKIYTRLGLQGFQNISFPSYNGFWSQDVPQNNQISLSNENVHGVLYHVAVLKSSVLFPQRTGTLTIDPVEADCVVRVRTRQSSNSIFDQFFGGGYRNAVYKIKSAPVKIHVMALPAKQPADFGGAVGKYTFKASLNKNKVKANDAIDLTITINGHGNLKMIDPPKITFPLDFEKYDPKINNKISVTANGVTGTKKFDYLIIPRHAGNYKIAPIKFSYFDPHKKKYITLPSQEFDIAVAKGDSTAAANTTMYTAVNKQNVKMVGNDIRYIKTGNIELKENDNYFFGSPGFVTGVASPLLAFICFLFFRRRYEEQNKDIEKVKSRKATKMAKKRLAIAQKHATGNDKEKFYDEILRALNGYLSDKLNIPVADLSRDSVILKLESRDVNKDTIDQLMHALDNCEYVRYAPSAVSSDLKQTYSETVKLITKLEDEI